MERLISSVDFSDYLNESPYMNNRKWEIHRNHVNFLKQKLELWMFVPCKLVEGVWVPIKGKENHFIRKELDEFREAKNRVLFEGFELFEMSAGLNVIRETLKFSQVFASYNSEPFYKCNGHNTIEDLVKYNLELTPTAKKQIGL